MFLTTWAILWNTECIFSFLAYKTLRAIVPLFFSDFFYSSFSDGKFIPSHLFIKGLIFLIRCGSYLISSWFTATVTAYWKHLLYLLLIGFIAAFCFLSSKEKLYVIHDNSDLCYDIYNTINEHNRRKTHYFPSIFLTYFDVC